MKLSVALHLRKIIEKAARSLEDTDAASAVFLFPLWSEGVSYVKDERVRFEGKLYRCLSDHVSQRDWAPPLAGSLFTEVADPFEEYPAWIRPSGAHNAYGVGDKVSHGGKRWISEVDSNVWEPSVYGWKEVSDV